jgi:hypothetical protein
MSILNLNGPQGRGSAGKKSLKIWIGVGLLAAVLGFGSTFAASITLNQPGGTTEFGQGVTQSVYCGGTQSVTITPLSTFQNTVRSAETPAQETITASVKVLQTSEGEDYVTVSNASNFRVTIQSKSSSSVPRWGSSVSNSTTTGFWITNATSGSSSAVMPTNSQLASGSYFFATETSLNSGRYKNVSNSYFDVDIRQVVLQAGNPRIPGAITSPSSFKVGGVLISDIPSACLGVNFVISSYAETGTAQSLISSGADQVKEVAALWTASTDSVVASKDRSTPVSTSLVSATQTSNTLKFTFNTGSGVALSANDLYKLVVETQEDALSDS